MSLLPSVIATERLDLVLLGPTFGGVGSSNNFLDDTWTWNGSAWALQSPAHRPGPRAASVMAYDPLRGVVVLYGGLTASTILGDTWVWDGTDWYDVTPSNGPNPRSFAALQWDARRGSVVLTGGRLANTFSSSDLFETWEWIGQGTSGSWQRIGTFHHAPGRTNHRAFALLDGSGIGVFGGTDTVGGTTVLSDVWALSYAGSRSADSCQIAIDIDGDDKIGCEDPDCWPVCTPTCAPGVSCPATAPRCGDGMCGVAESCRSCPADCTCAPVCGDFICDPGETCLGDC